MTISPDGQQMPKSVSNYLLEPCRSDGHAMEIVAKSLGGAAIHETDRLKTVKPLQFQGARVRASKEN